MSFGKSQMTLAAGCTAVEVRIPATGEQVGYSFVQEDFAMESFADVPSGFGLLALSSALRCRGRRDGFRCQLWLLIRLTHWRWIQTPVHGFAFGVW